MIRLSSFRIACAAVALATLVTLGVPALANTAKLEGVVNVNTATVEQLQQLPGIGASRARALVEARTSRGRFKTLEELLEVKGIGESSLARLRPHLTLRGETTARPKE